MTSAEKPTFREIWTDTLIDLAGLLAPNEFLDKDITNYHEAEDFLRAVGEALDPIVKRLLSDLQDTSGVSNSSEMLPSTYMHDFVVPEFTSTIDTLESEGEENDEEEPEPNLQYFPENRNDDR